MRIIKGLCITLATLLIVTIALSAFIIVTFGPGDNLFYPDGTVLFEGTRSGQGILYHANGSPSYKGGWRDGYAWGEGESFHRSRRWQEGGVDYSGEWKQGLYHGQGLRYNSSGHLVYEGEWVQGQRHGQGLQYSSSGNLIYDGQWHNGLRHGTGDEFSDGNLVYTGEWQNHQRHGLGKEFSPEGILLYEGQWQFGQRHGDGTEYNSQGDILYQGEWRDGKRNGYGIEYWPDGEILYTGTWDNNTFLSQETFLLPDGTPLAPSLGLVYSWAVDRGLSTNQALARVQEAQVFKELVEEITPDIFRQASLLSMLEVSPNYFDASPSTLNDWDNKLKQSLTELADLPLWLTQGLARQGLRTRFITGLVTDEREFEHLRDQENHRGVPYDRAGGMFILRHNLTLVRLNLPWVSQVASVTLHEFGHAVDYILMDRISGGREWDGIREEEASKVFRDRYFIDHPEEYFAEFFASWFLSQEHRRGVYLSHERIHEIAPETSELFSTRVEGERLARPTTIDVQIEAAHDGDGVVKEFMADPGTRVYSQSWHSDLDGLKAMGWTQEKLLGQLNNPQLLRQLQEPYEHEGSYILWLAVDEDGNYTLASEALNSHEITRDAHVPEELDPYHAQPLPQRERIQLAFTRFLDAIKGAD